MLVAVRELRKEREKVKELQTQKTEQRTAIGTISLVKKFSFKWKILINNCAVTYDKQNSFSDLVHSDQRIARLEQQLKDLRSAAVGATPEGLLQVKHTFRASENHIVLNSL